MVQCIEHLRIPTPDGARLGARPWLPESAKSEPVPAILEYIPCHQRHEAAFAILHEERASGRCCAAAPKPVEPRAPPPRRRSRNPMSAQGAARVTVRA